MVFAIIYCTHDKYKNHDKKVIPKMYLPGWQKPRRASLLPAVCPDSTPMNHLWSQPSVSQQRLLNYTGGPLGNIRD